MCAWHTKSVDKKYPFNKSERNLILDSEIKSKTRFCLNDFKTNGHTNSF